MPTGECQELFDLSLVQHGRHPTPYPRTGQSMTGIYRAQALPCAPGGESPRGSRAPSDRGPGSPCGGAGSQPGTQGGQLHVARRLDSASAAEVDEFVDIGQVSANRMRAAAALIAQMPPEAIARADPRLRGNRIIGLCHTPIVARGLPATPTTRLARTSTVPTRPPELPQNAALSPGARAPVCLRPLSAGRWRLRFDRRAR